MELRNRIRALVEARGTTLTQVAESMPTPAGRTSFWRVVSKTRPTKDPRASTLQKIARALGVTLSELLEGVEFD